MMATQEKIISKIRSVYSNYQTIISRTVSYNIMFMIPIIIFIWNYFTINNVLSYSMTWDEATFYKKALQNYYSNDFIALIAHKNEFGYGGGWFSIYSLMIYISELVTGVDYRYLTSIDPSTISSTVEDIRHLLPLIFMKLINVASINSMLLLLLIHYKNNSKLAIYAIITLLSSSMLYWSGKFASPDILVSSAIGIGVYLYLFTNKKLYAFIFMGIAFGLKLTGLPIVLSVLIYELIGNYKNNKSLNFKKLMQYILIVYSVFLILNLFLLTNASAFIDNIIFYSNGHRNHISSLSELISSVDIRLFTEEKPIWDLVYSGSLKFFATSPYFIFGLLFLSPILAKKKTISIFFIFSLLISLLFILRQSEYGWNWFPFIMMYPLLFLNFKDNKYSHKIGLAFITICLIHNFKYINLEVNNNDNHIQNISYFRNNESNIKKEITDFIKKSDFTVLRKLNFAEIGVNIEGYQSFFKSMWIIKDKYKKGDVVLLGKRTESMHPKWKKNLEGYKHLTKKINFISVYLILE